MFACLRSSAFLPDFQDFRQRGGAGGAALAVCLLLTVLGGPVRAETLNGAIIKAYRNNPDLGQQRAAVRAADENIPRQKSGYRPRVSATADAGYLASEVRTPGRGATTNYGLPRGVGLSVTQNLWSGNRVENGVRSAESSVFGAREQLRNTEQSVLQDTVTFYMNVLRDTALLSLRRNNVEVLMEQVRQTRDRFQVGDVTRTDVAQAEARLAQAQSDAIVAQANLQTNMSNYRQVVGTEPKRLEPVRPFERGLPKTLESAVLISQRQHPAIQALLHGVDAAQLNVKVIEGELYPTVGLTGTVSKRWDVNGVNGAQTFSGSIVGQISVPIYEGGEVYARARQAKETLSQQRLQADLQRDKVRAAVISAWGVFQASAQVIKSAQAQVAAAEIALNGVREEAKVGQRTTLDVLNAQQDLLNARVSLVTAQRDRVVGSYALQAATGRLSTAALGVNVEQYDPTTHFGQVKDKWFGLRTPDGQ
jgi:outer membrane protein